MYQLISFVYILIPRFRDTNISYQGFYVQASWTTAYVLCTLNVRYHESMCINICMEASAPVSWHLSAAPVVAPPLARAVARHAAPRVHPTEGLWPEFKSNVWAVKKKSSRWICKAWRICDILLRTVSWLYWRRSLQMNSHVAAFFWDIHHLRTFATLQTQKDRFNFGSVRPKYIEY